MWDEIDELVDHWTWVYQMTGRVAGSHLLRHSVPVVPTTEDADYKYQDLLDRRGEPWITSRDNPNN